MLYSNGGGSEVAVAGKCTVVEVEAKKAGEVVVVMVQRRRVALYGDGRRRGVSVRWAARSLECPVNSTRVGVA